MKKRLLSTFMALLMVCSLVIYLPDSIIVSAASFTPRTTAPSTSNSYYYSSNPFYKSGYGMPNCTCYAYGRAWEILGSKPSLSTGNAGKWYWYNKNNGIYSYGSTPKLGAIACWDKYDENQGHVAVVEAISGDTITISESHYKSTNFDTRNIASNSSNYLTSMRFCGYIYIGEFGIEPIDTPVDNSYDVPCKRTATKKYDVYDRYGNAEYNSSGVRRYIAQNDECTIHEVYGSGYVKVTYPVGSGTHTAYAKNDGWGLIPINVNHDPIGVVDRIEGGAGKINVYGWTYDPDNSSKSLEIHVYIGGSAGSNTVIHSTGGIMANADSPDVNSAYNINGKHRFNTWIETTARGNQPVYVYAINSEGGNNPCIGSGTVNITEPIPQHTATKVEAKAATCTTAGNTAYWYCSGCKKYFSDSACTKEITLASTVVKAKGHNFGSWTTTKAATCAAEGTKTHKCSVCGKTETASIAKTTDHKFGDWTVTKAATCAAEGTKTRKCSICGKTENQTIPKSNKHKYKVETIPPTTTEGGYDRHNCTLCGHFYIDNVVPPISVPNNPTVSYEKGNGSVKLTWNTVSGAQKYGIAGYQNGAWQLLDKTTGSSYTLKNLKAGTNYKVAVIAMFNSNWNMDFSNAITVTPNGATVSQYPVVQTQVKDSKIGFKWNKIPGVEKYGIGMYQANKWKVIKQLDGNVTTWTSPQISSGKYRLAVLAKVNGQWVNADVFKKSFYVTVE